MYRIALFNNRSPIQCFMVQISHFLFCNFLTWYELEGITGHTLYQIKLNAETLN